MRRGFSYDAAAMLKAAPDYNNYHRAPDWIHLELRCYGCDGDVALSDYQSDYYCSETCLGTLPLSAELTGRIKELVTDGRYQIPALDVADAMLGWKPNINRNRGHTDGIRSIQWRKRRLEELEHPAPRTPIPHMYR